MARPPAPIREEHAARLIGEARAAEAAAQVRRATAAQALGVLPTSEGTLLTFESWPGFELELSTFDPLRQAPELVAVREAGEEEERTQLATVHVPQGAIGYFLQRFERFSRLPVNSRRSAGPP